MNFEQALKYCRKHYQKDDMILVSDNGKAQMAIYDRYTFDEEELAYENAIWKGTKRVIMLYNSGGNFEPFPKEDYKSATDWRVANIRDEEIRVAMDIAERNDCKHLIGIEDPYIYDGVFWWGCLVHKNKKVNRWIMENGRKTITLDDKAIRKLCNGCIDYEKRNQE
jgi:hypothetical protein